MEPPVDPGNTAEASLTATERRDLILAVLALARGYSETYGRWPSIQEVEDALTGKRPL